MNLFLLWKQQREAAVVDCESVGRKLLEVFTPLFQQPPALFTRETPSASLAFLKIPLHGWRGESFQEDETRWVQLLDYPVNLKAALSENGVKFAEENILLKLCQELERDSSAVLRHLAPPFSVIWGRKDTREVFLQNDGLGQSQLLEYDDGKLWAVTNRVTALKALGVTPEPEHEEWATRVTLGWFPMNLSGFRNTRFLGPGTQLRMHREGIHRKQDDVLREWIHPPEMSREECLELGTTSLIRMIREAMTRWEKPTVGLSGGWDSRAIVALLRHLGADFSPRVRGGPERFDVIIASELARIAKLELKFRFTGGIPPDTVEGCEQSISRALLWQGGYMNLKKHKTFLVRGHLLGDGIVNVMGAHAGIGKADFAVKIGAHELPESEYESRLVEEMMKRLPFFMREKYHEPIRENIRAAYRQADRYDLSPLHRLHFFFLYEYTRRWASASLGSEVDLIFTPYLNPDFIRACYAYPAEEIPERPFHRFVTTRFAPDWAEVPYEDEVTREDIANGRLKAFPSLGDAPQDRPRWKPDGHHRLYHPRRYWKDVGKPLIRRARKTGGFCTELFDVGLIRQNWKKWADAIAVTHLLPYVLEDTEAPDYF